VQLLAAEQGKTKNRVVKESAVSATKTVNESWKKREKKSEGAKGATENNLGAKIG